jgi:hypothetical protein
MQLWKKLDPGKHNEYCMYTICMYTLVMFVKDNVYHLASDN